MFERDSRLVREINKSINEVEYDDKMPIFIALNDKASCLVCRPLFPRIPATNFRGLKLEVIDESIFQTRKKPAWILKDDEGKIIYRGILEPKKPGMKKQNVKRFELNDIPIQCRTEPFKPGWAFSTGSYYGSIRLKEKNYAVVSWTGSTRLELVDEDQLQLKTTVWQEITC